MKSLILKCLPLLSVLALCSCASLSVFDSDSASLKDWKSSGSLLIVRQLPAPSAPPVLSEEAYLAFMPTDIKLEGNVLVINRANMSGELFVNGKKKVPVTISSTGKSVQSLDLEPGSYEVVLKQVNPTWHANEEYFQARQLPIPPKGSKERFLKGALGSHAVFFNDTNKTALSDSASSETGSLVIGASAMSTLFETLEPGDSVIIR